MKDTIMGMALMLGLGAGCMTTTDDDEAVSDDTEDLGTAQDEVTGPGSTQGYTRGTIRLDYPGGGRCSAVLVGPNMIVTAAHCVSHLPSNVNSWNGMKYGRVNLRLVYKPSNSETMCLNRSCRSWSGNTRYTEVYAFWAGTYAGTGDWPSDIAVLTRTDKADFVARGGTPGAPPDRELNTGDYRRILNVSLPTSGAGFEVQVAGYGATADGVSTSNPHLGPMHVDSWNTHTLEARYNSGAFWASTCMGDSGGPMTFRPGVGTYTFLAGTTSGTGDEVMGSCPEPGDDIAFNRTSSKIWMLDRLRNWMEGEDCERYTSGSLPGTGSYFRCW